MGLGQTPEEVVEVVVEVVEVEVVVVVGSVQGKERLKISVFLP